MAKRMSCRSIIRVAAAVFTATAAVGGGVLALHGVQEALAAPSGLVAAYGFDEGSGTTVTDASGNGNNGTITNATWSTSGKYGKALQFNGTSALVTIPDAASLHLTTGMTLEAWVNPSTVEQQLARRDLQGQRQLLARGDVVERLASGRGPDRRRQLRRRVRHRGADGQHLVVPDRDLQRVDAAPVRQRDAGGVDRADGHDRDVDEPVADRRRQHLRPVLRRPDRRSPRLQRRADRRADPNRPGHRRSTLRVPDTTPPTQPGTLTATRSSGGEVDLSWGASTDNVGVTGYKVERCQGAGCTNFAQIARQPARPTRTPASARRRAIAIASARPTRRAT